MQLAILRTIIPPCLLVLGIFQTYEGKYLPHIRNYIDKAHHETKQSSSTQNAFNNQSSPERSENSNTPISSSTSTSSEDNADFTRKYKYQEELLLKQFFREMEKKNYSEADRVCAQIEKLSEESHDSKMIESAKELRRTYQAIVE